MRECRQRGQAILEFALVASLLLMLLIGIIAMGFVFSWHQVLNNAAREGARAAATGKTDAQVITDINNMITALPGRVTDTDPNPDPTGTRNPDIQISPLQASRAVGNPVTVTLIYRADVGVAFGGIIRRNYQLRGTATMRVERLP
ncbi:MAG: pilus assembly protein [Armatimonadetes bacterium]|nr:pilus assembly protein [Armatimonadota bacterium]MDW8120733.1 TadE/TadG family type IV pilus assembly protein [Armatimonadota bacterium]